MKWFQIFKVHNFVNDLMGLLGEVKAETEAKAEALKAQLATDRDEALAAIAQDSEDLDGRITARLEKLCNEMQVRMAKLEMAAEDMLKSMATTRDEMLKDAEEIRREVTRQSRRSDEFTSMIDSRTRSIGGKIREDFLGNIQAAESRAAQAAHDATAVAGKLSETFTGKLRQHERTVDQKLGLLAETAAKAEELARSAAQIKVEALAEVDKRLAAAPRQKREW